MQPIEAPGLSRETSEGAFAEALRPREQSALAPAPGASAAPFAAAPERSPGGVARAGQRSAALRLALPKGRMQAGVEGLLRAAGIPLAIGERGYRPRVGLPGVQTKLLKPQNIVEMLDLGSRDAGFAGADWVRELGAELVELVDTGLDPVRIVAAAPPELAEDPGWRLRSGLVVASEYTRLTGAWIEAAGLGARCLRTFGATEVFPPEDADLIVDNSASGATLEANRLVEIDELMRSTTRLYANPRSLEDPDKRGRLEELALLVRSVVEARARVMLEINVAAERLEGLCQRLPCMDRPTVARLVGDAGFGVKAAVPRAGLPALIAELRAAGGRDIVVSEFTQIVR
jgi:ATP phosphoribosyltransferase